MRYICWLILFCSFTIATSATSISEPLTLDILKCPQEQQPPTVALDYRLSTAKLVELGRDTYELSADVPPGRHWLSIKSGNCTDEREFLILAASPRHITVALTTGRMIFDQHFGIAGTLPLSGLDVTLLNAKEKQTPIQIDGKSYFSEHLAEGQYTLVLRLPNSGMESHIAVWVTNEINIRNISLEELRHNLSQGVYRNKDGTKTYIPAWSSPVPRTSLTKGVNP